MCRPISRANPQHVLEISGTSSPAEVPTAMNWIRISLTASAKSVVKEAGLFAVAQGTISFRPGS